jgi:hypothetical protein
MRFLLSVIAVCLVMITAKLYIPQVQADVAGMSRYDLRMDYDFKNAVKDLITKDYSVKNAIEDVIEDCELNMNYQEIEC